MFVEKYEKLLKFEKEYDLYNLTMDGQYYYPYLRQKIYGILLKNSGLEDAMSNAINKNNNIVYDKKKYISSLNTEIDSLVVDFSRFTFDENYNVIDAKTEEYTQLLEKNGKKYVELVYDLEQDKVRKGDNIYYMDDAHLLYEHYKWHKYKLKHDPHILMLFRTLGIHIPEDVYNEIIAKMYSYHNYFRYVFNQVKPKQIVITSNYMRQPLVIIAKEMNIPVVEIQYAAITRYHNGYDFGGNRNNLYPDCMVCWSEYFANFKMFPANLKSKLVIGNDESYDYNPIDKKVIFISQNLISKSIINEAIKFKKLYPEYDVNIKKHPNEYIDHEYVRKNGVKILDGNLKEEIASAELCFGAGSTALIEAYDIGVPVIVLNLPLQYFMQQFVIEGHFAFLNDISEFKNLKIIKPHTKIINGKKDLDLFSKLPFAKKEELKLMNSDTKQYVDLAHQMMASRLPIVVDNFVIEERLSIIIPMYNAIKTLPRLFGTIRDQKYFKLFDIIFVDDCSSDGTYEYCKNLELEHANITTLTTKVKSGSAATPRNTGISHVTSKYMAFIDSDDYLYGDHLSYMFYNTVKNDNTITVCNVLTNKNGTIGKYSFTDDVKKNPESIFETVPFVWNKIFRSDVIVTNKLKFGNGIGEDKKFIMDYYYSTENLVLEKLELFPVVYDITHVSASLNFSINNIVNTLNLRLSEIKLLLENGKSFDYIAKYVEQNIYINIFSNEEFINGVDSLSYNDKQRIYAVYNAILQTYTNTVRYDDFLRTIERMGKFKVQVIVEIGKESVKLLRTEKALVNGIDSSNVIKYESFNKMVNIISIAPEEGRVIRYFKPKTCTIGNEKFNIMYYDNSVQIIKTSSPISNIIVGNKEVRRILLFIKNKIA